MTRVQAVHGESSVPEVPLLIRHCEKLEEFAACVELQAEVWGLEDRDVVPCRSFVVARKIGGQVIGAFDPSRSMAGEQGTGKGLIGFAMALPAFSEVPAGLGSGGGYLHSHMLAVEPDYRDRGVGRRLKLFQREDALARGIEKMEWTFDPLEIKNAFFNIVKMGVIVRRYSANLYGNTLSRDAALPSDRLHAEWWMRSERVISAIGNAPPAGALRQPKTELCISVPRKIYDWRRSSEGRMLALRTQEKNRRQFEDAFASGLAVTGFHADSDGNGIFELGRWDVRDADHSRDVFG